MAQGLDIPDVELVIQVGYIASLCTLMQCFGRGARNRHRRATAVYLVEAQHFEGTKESNAALERKRRQKAQEDV